MHRVEFRDPLRYELAVAVATPLGATVDPSDMSVNALGPLANLLQLLATETFAVLPVRHAEHDDWIIAGETRRDHDMALTGVSRFVVPTYAEHEGGTPIHREFDQTEEPIGRLGHAFYPAGYYMLRSPSAHFDRVLARLGCWATLEVARPQFATAREAGYRDLHDEFSAALSAGAWDVAVRQLAEIRRCGLATADNLAFLEVQLLAQQRRWLELWHREDYRDIARLRMPRSVRDALLAAFHQSELLPLEQAGHWPETLDAFRRLRARLGGLLEGVADTTYGPALRAFAYRELAAGDRGALVELVNRAPDKETRLAIEALVELLPAESFTLDVTTEKPLLSPEQALRSALMDGHYDEAWRVAEQLDNPAARAQGMLEAAFFSEDLARAEEALLQFWALPQDNQDALLEVRRYAQIINALSDTIAPNVTETPTEVPISDWVAWLSAAAENPDDRRLPQALTIVAAADARYWTDERVAELAERLTELAAGGVALTRPHLRDAIRRLRDHFLQDSLFPRDDATYADVYEALYTATLDQGEVNALTALALLRLAEARLRRAPSIITSVAEYLADWLNHPAPALGDVALEAFDLLAAYGAQGPAFGPWLRSWVETILGAPRQPDRAALEDWLAFTEWAQPGNDLLERLREMIASFDATEDDPISLLPDGCTIGIFTLRLESAVRAGEQIRRRNPSVQVRLCGDTVLTDQARALAQGADFCVVVTTCITHALTYGIMPYVDNPVYPQSSGSTSIVKAIEERARSLVVA